MTTPQVAAAERPPRISEALADGPTQRLYAVSAFLLVQSLKLADFVFAVASISEPDDEGDVNWRLVKWLVIDTVLLMALQWLRIPRLALGLKAVWLARLSLFLLDWVLFGRWEARRSTSLNAR